MQTVEQIIQDLEAGGEFIYQSARKHSRTYTIKAIVRADPMGNLFTVKAKDLKHSAGLYNRENIKTVIDLAMRGITQTSFRIR